MTGRDAALIVLDLDGTSLCHGPEEQLDPDLCRLLGRLGTAWAINSDRYLRDIVRLVHDLPPASRPVAILSMQRFVHIRDRRGRFRPDSAWNQTQRTAHQALWQKIAPSFAAWREEFAWNYGVIDSLVDDQVFSFRVPGEQVENFRRGLRSLLEPWPEAQVCQSADWIYVVHASFSKAAVLRRLTGKLGIDARRIVAVGDGANDLSMLDGALTPLVGCPASACRAVVDAVRAAGGYIANEPAARGTAEVIRHYVGRVPPRAAG